jgi:CelD/BcsL family acetyltransferase involved in cellulose biosynthesis
MVSIKPSIIRIKIVSNYNDLETLVPQWSELAQNAVDANAFYEPWIVLPALRNLQSKDNFLFLLIYVRNSEEPTNLPLLCGFFPLEQEKTFRGIPCKALRLMKTTYSRLSTPLIHRNFVKECVCTVLDWFETNSESASLIELGCITGEGRIAQEFHQQISDRQWIHFQYECTIRALLKPQADAQTYLKRTLQGKHLKELHRLERKLTALGPTSYRYLEPQEDPKPWIDTFLRLESSGWKGKSQTSLAANLAAKVFFEEFTTGAHRNGQLMMLGLFHQDKPIALKCNILSGNGAFAFKIAYDERFAAFSPGVQLELENIRRFHHMPQLHWMDSTAESRHFMINRLWIDRRSIETLIFSPNRTWGNCIISIFPLLRWIKSSLRRKSIKEDK